MDVEFVLESVNMNKESVVLVFFYSFFAPAQRSCKVLLYVQSLLRTVSVDYIHVPAAAWSPAE